MVGQLNTMKLQTYLIFIRVKDLINTKGIYEFLEERSS